MGTSFYSREELAEIGFSSYGENVLISRKASIYGAANISIGNNVRVDDFCILSGKIELKNNNHIAAYTALYGGQYGICVEDFSVVSGRCSIYAASDDYSGEAMISPMVPEEYCNVTGGKVTLKKHVLIGAGSTVLPGVTINEGTSVGSMSLVKCDLEPWSIYAGIPCRKIKNRSKRVLELEDDYRKKYGVHH